MTTLSSILTKHHFKQLRPGENESSFMFSGPGICIITLEKRQNDETIYRSLEAYSAEDILEVAKRLLSHPRKESEQGYVFAFLATVSTKKGERLAVLEELSKHCKTGSE